MIKKSNNKKILSYLKVYKSYLLGVLISLMITSSSILVMSHGLGYFIDKAIVENNLHMVNQAMLYFLLLAFLLAIATGLRYSLITLTGEYVIRDLRRDMHHKILELSPSFYEDAKVGEVLSRLNADTTLLQSVISSSISVAMRNLIMLIGGLIMLAIASIKLTIMILSLIPLVLIPIIWVRKKLKNVSRKYQDLVADLASVSEETITFIKVVQAYVREKERKEKFLKSLNQTVDTGRVRIKIRAVLVGIVICLIFSGIAFVLWIGSLDVMHGTLTPGQLSTFIFLSLIIATTSMSITEAFGEIQRALGATQRIFEFLSMKTEIQNPKTPIKLPPHNTCSIEFKEVNFSYNHNRQVLHDISFTLQPGKTLAIVGESGAGKSTIAQLALRFYDIQSGEILLNGININSITLQELRDNFGYVGQDYAVFSASAYENILYGNPLASKEEIIQAAKSASAYDFIQKLPDGFDTFLGEKGAKISGGQKQRIAIARAILKNPQILLLDEATSALDSKNESAIQEALETLMHNRTTIVIAHRVSTIIKADQIILLANGHIIAQGTHQQLMSESKAYQKHFKANIA